MVIKDWRVRGFGAFRPNDPMINANRNGIMEFILAQDLASQFDVIQTNEPAGNCDCGRSNKFLYVMDEKTPTINMCKCKTCGREVHWFCAERHADNCWKDWLNEKKDQQ